MHKNHHYPTNGIWCHSPSSRSAFEQKCQNRFRCWVDRSGITGDENRDSHIHGRNFLKGNVQEPKFPQLILIILSSTDRALVVENILAGEERTGTSQCQHLHIYKVFIIPTDNRCLPKALMYNKYASHYSREQKSFMHLVLTGNFVLSAVYELRSNISWWQSAEC